MPSYRLFNTKEYIKRRYTREELLEMTTLQLREICYEEKIVKGFINTLDRESLIRTILKYRGAEENLLIRDYRENGFERVNEALKNYLITKLPDHEKIKIPAKITLFPEIGITKEDMYKVEVENDLVEESNVLLVNENNHLCGIFNLVKDVSSIDLYYLVTEKNLRIEKSGNRNYSFLFFKKDDSEYIYKTYYSEKPLTPANFQYYKIPLADLEIRELEETGTVLAVDFGTSNTTAGAYLGNNYVSSPCYNDILNERIKINEINFVKFLDVTEKDEKWIEMLPTVVYVADCADSQNIKYYFGYEAKNIMRKNDYTSNASVFQGIKRWVNNYTKIEEIYDEQGNVAFVKRGDIVRAYIKHIIMRAEHQFKCRFKYIHISSPVKLKQQFIDMFQEIIPEYVIESEDALDEGIAVLYNTIANQIEKNKFVDGEEYKALIVDCGGGTTDLSSCAFRIEEGYISYKIDIKTTYENGDTNFGGNNITYKIMQFMKIVFANYYKNNREVLDIDDLIDIPSADIFRHVDEEGVAAIYERFEKYYEEAEKIIPTRFKEYENKVRDDYQQVKNNFYFLWEIADNMKKEFFRKTSILRNRFDSSEMDKNESDLHITTLNKWCISILDNGEFKTVYEFPKVVFNIKEINKLIKADIYEIVRKFLEIFYQNRKLQDYSIIKLTGQSCRIDVFKEALKEFVPGRSIEFKQKKQEDENISDLKLSCLRGVLRYINSKKIGDIEASIQNDIPVIPYSVSAFTYNKQEKTLICSLERMNQAKGYISRPIGVEEIEFYLKNPEGILRQKYVYENDFNDYVSIMAEEIVGKHEGKIFQDETDTIRNGEVRFFLFAHDKNWGFHVVPIARKDEQLFMGKKKFFAFEDELSELDFFDGLK
ncbi:MAG: molecular chaperone [Clostridia bacterium]|nr:molecular chaperone [Clostridia bacterium]